MPARSVAALESGGLVPRSRVGRATAHAPSVRAAARTPAPTETVVVTRASRMRLASNATATSGVTREQSLVRFRPLTRVGLAGFHVELDDLAIEGTAADFEHLGCLFLVPGHVVKHALDVNPFGLAKGRQLRSGFGRGLQRMQELDVLGVNGVTGCRYGGA